MARFDRNLDGVTVLDRAGAAAVDLDLELAAPELNAEPFPG
jgi:hypothetical protein